MIKSVMGLFLIESIEVESRSLWEEAFLGHESGIIVKKPR